MPLIDSKEVTVEEIRETLTLNVGLKELWDVFVPHSTYEIKGCGFVKYVGNNVWKIDHISFPVDCVEKIDLRYRKIYLR